MGPNGSQVSFISGKRIAGAFMCLGSAGNMPTAAEGGVTNGTSEQRLQQQLVSTNEAACWARVNPFCPTMTGEFINV
jgi:hypothetical protein